MCVCLCIQEILRNRVQAHDYAKPHITHCGLTSDQSPGAERNTLPDISSFK